MAARLQDKVVLISGGARGQGEAEARLFASEGARVIVSDVLDREGKAVAESLGDAAIFCHHDVRSEEAWLEVVAAGKDAFGKIDVLINNAGVLLMRSIFKTSVEDYMRVVEINQLGCFLGMKTVAPAMIEAGGGSIVNISSVAGKLGVPNLSAYTASKFAVRGMTKVAALELGRHGIRVNSIHPGGVATPMVMNPDAQAVEPGVELPNPYAALPAGRIGTAEEMAKLALFLASDDSSYCTGSEFVADGGQLAGNIPPGMRG